MYEEIKERQESLFYSADNLIRHREIWSNSPDEGLRPDTPFWEVAENFCTAFTDGMIPASCRRLTEAAMVFIGHWIRYRDRAEFDANPNVAPDRDFWKAVDGVQEMRARSLPKPPRRLESLQHLMDQKVSDHQIATIYDWYLPDGSPDLSRVYDAKIDPKAFDESQRGQTANSTTAIEDRRVAAAREQSASANARINEKMTKAAAVVEQSSIELTKQGVPAQFIASMKGITVEEVRHELLQAGLEPIESTPVHASASAYDKPLSETELNRLDAQAARHGREQAPYDDDEPQSDSEAQLDELILLGDANGLSREQIANARNVPISRVNEVLGPVQNPVTA